jgi:hypothetical protein
MLFAPGVPVPGTMVINREDLRPYDDSGSGTSERSAATGVRFPLWSGNGTPEWPSRAVAANRRSFAAGERKRNASLAGAGGGAVAGGEAVRYCLISERVLPQQPPRHELWRQADRPGGQAIKPLAGARAPLQWSAIGAVRTGGLKGALRRPMSALDPASVLASTQLLRLGPRTSVNPVRVLSAGCLKETAHRQKQRQVARDPEDRKGACQGQFPVATANDRHLPKVVASRH